VIVCVSASPSIDKLFEVERLEPGAIHRPTTFVQVPGGKGLNAARVAARLGAEVRAVALVGGHAGAWIEDALAAEGIDATFARGEHETRACLSVADAHAADLTEFYEFGPEVSPETWDELEAVIADVLPGSGWLTLSGSIPPGAREDGYVRLAASARSAGVRVALDTRGPALATTLPSGPDIVKVNAAEAAGVVGYGVEDTTAAFRAAGELRTLAGGDGHTAVVTLGSDGAAALGASGEHVRAMLDARGRYPVGSGDAFLAGLIASLDGGGTLREALALALGAGSANAEVPGPGRLDGERARALGARARVERV
jgi:1-phosphofructokinase family hexose kinase